MLISCPYATLMASTKASPQWSIDDIVQSMRCRSCYVDLINHWAPCQRLIAQINLHPELTSRCRQMWYLCMQFSKFMIPEDDILKFEGDAEFEFLGENTVKVHRYMINSADRRKILEYMPKHLQTKPIITRGIIFIFYYKKLS